MNMGLTQLVEHPGEHERLNVRLDSLHERLL
jgi:hypothetical protein